MNRDYFVLFIPGNPGSPSDFNTIAASLASDRIECRVFERPLGQTNESVLFNRLKQELQPHADKIKILVTYSWGCYFSAHMLQKLDLKIDKLIFIAPSLDVLKPISTFLFLLANVPILNQLVLNKLSPRHTQKFINNLFLPDKPTVQQRRELSRYLDDWRVWRDAIRLKYRQQRHPLKNLAAPICKTLIVVYGESDPSALQSVKHKLLQPLLADKVQLHFQPLPGSGHAVLWTHRQIIIDTIESALNPIKIEQTGQSFCTGYFPGKTERNNIVNLIRRHAETYPKRAALTWCKEAVKESKNGTAGIETETISYQDFYYGIERLALGLRKIGINEGDRVMLFLPMGVQMYTALFAVMWLGAITVFIDSWARRSQIGACASNVKPKALISHLAAFELIALIVEFDDFPMRIIAGNAGSQTFDASLEDLMNTQILTPLPLTPVHSEHSALITFTTGSSGEPKGANRTHRFLSAQHTALNRQIPYLQQDIDMPAFPIFSLNNLACGINSLLPALDLAEPKDSDAAVLAAQIRFGQVSCVTLSVSMMHNLAAHCLQHKLMLPGLRRVITGGAPVSKDNVLALKNVAPQVEIHILYGSTEVEPIAHITDRELLATAKPDDPELIEEGVNVGKIVSGLKVKLIKPFKGPVVLTETGWAPWQVEPGVVGELIVSGDHVCERYYNNEAAFLDNKIIDRNGRIWHRTGDLVRLTSDHNLYVVGRVHNLIERNKHYLFPVKAEILLKRCQFVKRAAYLGLPDPGLGEKTGIAVEFKQSNTAKQAYIQEVLRLF